jgi:hypothetical protein
MRKRELILRTEGVQIDAEGAVVTRPLHQELGEVEVTVRSQFVAPQVLPTVLALRSVKRAAPLTELSGSAEVQAVDSRRWR